MPPLDFDLRTRTALVCGALALAIAVSTLLRGRVRAVHFYFAAFAGDIGLWYLSQSFYGFFQATIWERFTAVLAVLLPQFALQLFEAMIPHERGRKSQLLRFGGILMVPMLILVLGLADQPWVRVVLFFYVFLLMTAGLYQLGQRGATSPSRATQRRVKFLVVIGAAAGLATVFDFVWFLGATTPPVGAALSVVFLFVLAQALRHERLLDLYEMLARLLVATAVAFLIAFIFYLLLTFIGGFSTMYLNAVLAAIVVLVLFEPLKDRVEEQVQRLFFRERFDLERAVLEIRKQLAHTVEVQAMADIVVAALEQSRRVTTAAFYLRDSDGFGFERVAALGSKVPKRIEVATAGAMLDRLTTSSLDLEFAEQELAEKREHAERDDELEALAAATATLGALRYGVWLAVRSLDGEVVGLLSARDERIRDAFAQDDMQLLEQVAVQMGVVIDNSRRYAQMKERDRLALLGQMAAGLAHEIRNPLGAIKGAAQLLSDPGPEGDDVSPADREFLSIILEEVERLNDVVGNVLDLARPKQDAIVPCDVNLTVEKTVRVLSAEPELENVDTELNLAGELPRAGIDAEQLRQVLLNLVHNAAQAMKGRGEIRISTRVRFGRGTHSGSSSTEPFVEVMVADTGPGIPQSLMENIFMPFYTTKDKGTGLGLSISQRIVQGVGGRIEVRSYEGKGSTFSVVVPVIDALPTPRPKEVRLSAPPIEPTPSEAVEGKTTPDVPPVGATDEPSRAPT